MDRFRLDGQVAFVTGAGSGIGQRLAIGLAEAGADVTLFDLPSSQKLEETAQAVRDLGKTSLVVLGDVRRAEDLQLAVRETEAKLGNLEIALNCAGIANAHPAEELAQERWQQMIDVNLTGVFLSCQAQAQAMLKHERGSIVNIASMSGTIVNRGLSQAHYNTSKAGVIHLSKSLAMEWCQRGIRVNSISPGYTATPMNLRPEVAEQTKVFENDTPLGRMASVDELVGPAIFLASQASSFCTGIDILVDGGFVCW